jgi:hypothetical protein
MNVRRYPYTPMTHARGVGQFIITKVEHSYTDHGYGPIQLSQVVLQMESTGDFNRKLLAQILNSGTPVSIEVAQVPR